MDTQTYGTTKNNEEHKNSSHTGKSQQRALRQKRIQSYKNVDPKALDDDEDDEDDEDYQHDDEDEEDEEEDDDDDEEEDDTEDNEEDEDDEDDDEIEYENIDVQNDDDDDDETSLEEEDHEVDRVLNSKFAKETQPTHDKTSRPQQKKLIKQS